MSCPFTGPKMFCARPNFMSLPKNLTAFSTYSKTFVPAQKPILLTANHLFVWYKIFVIATICEYIFGLAQKIWTSSKHFWNRKRTRHKSYLYFRFNHRTYVQNRYTTTKYVIIRNNPFTHRKFLFENYV